MKQILAIFAFCLGVSAAAGTAHAQFTVLVDCHGSGGNPSWSASNNTITVKVYTRGNLNVTWTGKPTTLCDRTDHILINSGGDTYRARDVTSVKISTNGEDTFWVDKLMVIDDSYKRQWGSDDNSGWCFSTNTADFAAPYCSSALSTLTFNV